MPDDLDPAGLDRAVDVLIEAHLPQATPPFAVVEDRKRRRDRRRAVAAGGALSAMVLAAAAVALPSLAGGGDRLLLGGRAPAGSPGEPVAVDPVYGLIRGDTGLRVAVPVGGGCSTTGTASVTADETGDTVTLVARVVRPPSPAAPSPPPGVFTFCASDLVIQRVTVSLDSPLRGRRVVDGTTGVVLEPAKRD